MAYTYPDATSPSEAWVKPPTFVDVHPGDLYSMLPDGLRALDEVQGTGLLKRFLDQPEVLWRRWQQKVWRLSLLHDPSKVPEALLSALAALVGFGDGSGEPWTLYKALSIANKRKIISLAVPYWIRRGRRVALDASIRFITGLPPAIDDWFSVRSVVGEILMGQEGGAVDPWMIWSSRVARDAEPGGASANDDFAEHHVSIRVPGVAGTSFSAERTFVQDIVELARPFGERYEIAFPELVDTFQSGVLSHWLVPTGAMAPVASAGVSSSDPVTTAIKLPGMVLRETSKARLDFQSSATWKTYLASWLWKIDDPTAVAEARFYVQSANPASNYYWLRVEPSAPSMKLGRTALGISTTLATIAKAVAVPATNGFRIEAYNLDPVTTLVQLRAWYNGDLQLSVEDDRLFSGTFEFVNGGIPDIEVQRFEIFQHPLTSVTLTP